MLGDSSLFFLFFIVLILACALAISRLSDLCASLTMVSLSLSVIQKVIPNPQVRAIRTVRKNTVSQTQEENKACSKFMRRELREK